MKKLFLFLLVAMLVNVSTSNAVNLLQNPGFETWFDSLGVQVPEWWVTSAFVDSGSAYRSNHAYSGNYSIALGKTVTIQGFAISLVPIVGGTHYDFSLWLDIPALMGIGSFHITQLDINDSIVDFNMTNSFHTTDWMRYAWAMDAHPNAVWALVTLSAVEDTTFFDELTLDGEPGTGVSERKSIHTVLNAPILKISPNPCRGPARILAVLGQPGCGEIRIFDTSGRSVRRYEISGTGPVTVAWDGRDSNACLVPSGVYFVRLDMESDVLFERITVIR